MLASSKQREPGRWASERATLLPRHRAVFHSCAHWRRQSNLHCYELTGMTVHSSPTIRDTRVSVPTWMLFPVAQESRSGSAIFGRAPPSWQYAVKKALENCGVDLAEFEKHFQFRPVMEQKGVDTLIVLDLVRLAQRRAYDTAFLIAGDRDLAEAVRVAQEEGRRVVLLHPSGGGVATELRHLADEVRSLDETDLKLMLRVKP